MNFGTLYKYHYWKVHFHSRSLGVNSGGVSPTALPLLHGHCKYRIFSDRPGDYTNRAPEEGVLIIPVCTNGTVEMKRVYDARL